MKTYQHRGFWSFSLYHHLSHATTRLAVLMAFVVILVPSSAAQNEGLPSSPPQTTKSDGFSFDPKLRLNPSMAIILVCLLSAFFIMGCVSVSVRHCSLSLHHPPDVLAEDRVLGSRRRSRQVLRRGLDSSIIDGFPVFQYSDVKELRLGKGALECAVCLNEFEDHETLRLIPNCSHVFHPDCIDAWLASHVTCPVCRANLDPTPGDHEGDDDPETQDSVPELPISVPTQDSGSPVHERNNLGINIHIGSPGLINQCPTSAQNFQKITRMNGQIQRSYSMGHTRVQLEINRERFTLRLPDDVRTRLINLELCRTQSCVSFTRIRSSTKGFRRSNSGGRTRANFTNHGRLDRAVRSEDFGHSISPTFFSGSSPTMEGISEQKPSTNLRSLLRPARSFRTPLERLFSAREKGEFDGERSFSRLMLDDSSV